jgi:PAS domain S-box-containing protein
LTTSTGQPEDASPTEPGLTPVRWAFRFAAATRYGIAIAVAVAAILLRFALNPIWGSRLPFILFFPAIMVSGWFGGFWPGIVSTLLCAAAGHVLWMKPPGAWMPTDSSAVISLLVFVGVGALISGLNEAWRRAERARAALLEKERGAHSDAQRAAEELRQLQALTDTALAEVELPVLMRELLARIRTALATDAATILLVDSEGRYLRPVASDGLEAELGRDFQIPLGQGLAGRIATSDRVVMVEDLSQEDVVVPVVRERLRSLIGAPLTVRGRLLGVMHTGMLKPRRFTEPEAHLLSLTAERVALAIERARLVEEERASRHEAETTVEQLRMALAAGRMGSWQYTLASGAVEWSPELEAIHGYSAGGFPGTFDAFRQEIHPDDRERVLAAIRAAVEQDLDHHVEYRIVRRDGTVRWVEGRGQIFHDTEGKPERMVGVCMDVTQRRQHEERFRRAVEAAPAAMLMVDERGTIVLVNALTEQLLGYARDELVGQPVERLVPERFRGRHAEHRTGFLAESRQRPMGAGRDLYVRRKDGSEAPVVIGLSPLDTADGRFVLAAVTDITDRKEAERTLREADRRKDEFLAMLAHELRNPLGAISNAAQLLKQLGPPEGNQRWARDVIDRQTTHLARMVDDLLNVSRISRGQIVLCREPIPLAAAVALALETATPLFEARRQRFTSTIPPDPVWVDGDATRLAQVIGNLLGNASKYTRQGGAVWLTVRCEADQAVIRVRDTGIGIEPEMLPRVFDMFVQGEPSPDRGYGGLGLGLTLARSLTEMHGGKIEAFSAGLGQGSEFVVRLPILVGEPPVKAKPRPVTVHEAIRRRILVVDDNADSAEALALALEVIGHETRLASDGPAALQVAAEFRPEVAILDIGLPGMDGYEVARRLRTLSESPIVIVALTGYGQDQDRKRGQEAGFDHYLVKPASPEAVLSILDSSRPPSDSSDARPPGAARP